MLLLVWDMSTAGRTCIYPNHNDITATWGEPRLSPIVFVVDVL